MRCLAVEIMYSLLIEATIMEFILLYQRSGDIDQLPPDYQKIGRLMDKLGDLHEVSHSGLRIIPRCSCPFIFIERGFTN